MKKFLLAAIFGLTIVFATAQAQAAEIFVGTSNAMGRDCYVLTDSISHKDEHRMLVIHATPQDTPIEWSMYTVCREY